MCEMNEISIRMCNDIFMSWDQFWSPQCSQKDVTLYMYLCNDWCVQEIEKVGDTSVSIWSKPTVKRKTKIVCTIGPSTDTREMIWKLAEAGMNVARMNMSHGDHASHQKVIDLVKEYNNEHKDNVIAIMLDTKVSFILSKYIYKC